MAPYDSDSSDGEGDDFTETNVLLGYASKDPEDDSITRLGGRPDWLDDAAPPSAALARCKICKDLMVLLLQLNGELPDRFPGHERRLYVFACRKKGCRRREGSVRALRGVRVAPGSKTLPVQSQQEKPKPKPKEDTKPSTPSNLGETLFGAKTMGSSFAPSNPFSNPFSTTTPASSSGGNPFSSNNPYAAPPALAQPPVAAADTKPEPKPEPSPLSPTPATTSVTETEIESLPKTFAETLSLNNPQSGSPPTPPEPWPPESSQPRPYPVSYLSDAEYETLDPTPPPVSQATALDIDSSSAAADDTGKGGGKNGREDRDVFESSMDAAFQRFADRLSQNPEQCIRYEFGGQPLLYSRADAVGQRLLPGDGAGTAAKGMPRCPSCGAPRTFEVQLCPHAIAELEADEPLSLDDSMDWGTVVVGVCERDCHRSDAGAGTEAGAAYLEEWVGVQWEELGGGGAIGGGKGR